MAINDTPNVLIDLLAERLASGDTTAAVEKINSMQEKLEASSADWSYLAGVMRGVGEMAIPADVYTYIDEQIALISGGAATSLKIDNGEGGGRYLNWFFGYTSNTSIDDAGYLDLATFASVGQNNDPWLHIPLNHTGAARWPVFKINITTISDFFGETFTVGGKVTASTLTASQSTDATRAKLQVSSNGQTYLSVKYNTTYHAQIRIDQFMQNRFPVIDRTDIGPVVFSLSDIAP